MVGVLTKNSYDLSSNPNHVHLIRICYDQEFDIITKEAGVGPIKITNFKQRIFLSIA